MVILSVMQLWDIGHKDLQERNGFVSHIKNITMKKMVEC
jgi:hypothetical protein